MSSHHFPRRSPISREEEMVLLRRYQEQGDVEARNRVVESNMGYVLKMATRYANASGSRHLIDDIIGVRVEGLLRAADKFDLTRGTRFSTCATWWIRQGIIAFLCDNQSLVRVRGGRQRWLLLSIVRHRSDYIALHGTDPTPAELAQMLGVKEWQINHVDSVMRGDISLNLPVYSDVDDRTLQDSLSDPAPRADEVVEFPKACGEERLHAAFHHLPPREQDILRRHVMEGEESLEQIGASYGVTRERIRQIQKRGLDRLRKKLGVVA